MAFVRDTPRTSCFGMLPRNRARLQAREQGRVAAETGRHRGGPCPAVCLATLTGWSYARADVFLQRTVGFTGAGLVPSALQAAYNRALGVPWHQHGPTGLSVAETVRRLVAQHGPINGAVYCQTHVMPVRNGKLLNAAGCGSMPARGGWYWTITEGE